MGSLSRWSVLGMCLAFAGCSNLPSQGPTASEVLSGAVVDTPEATPRYLLANLDPRTVEILKQ